MKKFILNTTSESCDHYTYLIEHPEEPTSEELDRFLRKCGSDFDEDETYENVDSIIEIEEDNFKKIPD